MPPAPADLRRFYSSGAWRRARRRKLVDSPLCERCLEMDIHVPATCVHHQIEVRHAWSLRTDQGYLQSLCWSCHTRLHNPTKEAFR